MTFPGPLDTVAIGLAMKLKPNDPCWCESGRKYKKCHKAFDEAPEARKYEEAQKAYAQIWRSTAALQHGRGDYDWMSAQLDPYDMGRLLDVGCGSGHGLLALTTGRPALRIVAVDENLECLKIAADTLAKAGLSAQLVTRLDTKMTPAGFLQTGKPITDPLPMPIALVEADPMSDAYLEEALVRDGLFDAVTIWLTGAHMWRRTNVVSRSRGARSEHDLRILLQNDVYELADRILRRGGVLQVVDRSEAPTSDVVYNGYLDSHREQAEPTSMDVREIAYRLWETPEGAGTKLITTTPDTRDKGLPPPELALVSIISVKT